MEIWRGNELEREQLTAANNIVEYCRNADKLTRYPNYRNELNIFRGMDCFHIAIQDGLAVGFLSVFAPLSDSAEFSAFVMPGARNQGVFKTLVKSACDAVRSYGIEDIRFIHEPVSPAGGEVAKKWGMTPAYSEYNLSAPTESFSPALREGAVVRLAESGDVLPMARISSRLFGDTETDVGLFLAKIIQHPDVRIFVHTDQDVPVSMCCARLQGTRAQLFGFGTEPREQKRGFGRELLSGLCAALREEGIQEVTLQVDSQNPGALAFFQKNGFSIADQADYYAALASDFS